VLTGNKTKRKNVHLAYVTVLKMAKEALNTNCPSQKKISLG